MAVGTIASAKELAQSYRPLMLAVFTLADGTVFRAATMGLNTADGEIQYGGNDYACRILNTDTAALQALSEQGIIVTPSVTVEMADADKSLWTNYESAIGFKGAELRLRFVLYDVIAKGFSSDYVDRFLGVCDAARMDNDKLTVTAGNKINMARINVPQLRIQPHCANLFPVTALQRQDGADNEDSPFYFCGYSPDASGGNARGNLNSGSPFTSCGYTKEDCIARGMYTTDSSARVTGRFTGVTFTPPESSLSRSYISGKFEEVTNNGNEAKYGDFVPLVYGRAWVDAKILNVVGDGNYTKMEALLCWGEAGYIYEVLVNDVSIPHTYDDTEMSYVSPGVPGASEAQKGGWWKAVNRGDRDGAPNDDALYDSKGDPYGNLCVIEIVVPRKLADSGAIPRVRVLLDGPKIRNYSGVSTYTKAFTSLTPWILLDLLTWTNLRYSDIDIQSFIDGAAKAAVAINFTDQYGGTGSHSRYQCSLVIQSRRAASEVVRGLLNNMKAVLVPNYAGDGKLRLVMKETLASQQPSAVTGSNYNTAISSKTVAGVTANGYVAYLFNDSNIKQDSNGRSTLRLYQSNSDAAPNRISLQFQNSENRQSNDTFTMLDSEDIARVGREIDGGFPVDGINSHDQAARCLATYMAENYRGNPRTAADGSAIGDTGGTIYAELETTFKAIYVQIGQIVALTNAQHGLTLQLFRVTRIAPTLDFKSVSVQMAWHNDEWYLDTFGQRNAPRYKASTRNRLARPAYPWCPFGEQPDANDPLFDSTEWNMALAQSYENAADGTAITRLKVAGVQPVNIFPASPVPPYVPLQGTTATTGGSLPGDWTYYVAIAAKDANGKYTPLSQICTIYVPAGTNTNTITIPSLQWSADTSGYGVFAGTNPHRLSYQSDTSGTPSSITLTSLSEALWGAPDQEFDKLRIRLKRVPHAGVWGAAVVAVTSTTIQISVPSNFTTNEWAGYDLAWLGAADNAALVPIAHFRVASNDGDTLTLAASQPDPSALGMAAGDVVVMLSKPTVGSDAGGNYLSDALWQNVFAASGLTVDAEIGRVLRIIAGTGRGQTHRIKSNTATKVYIDGEWTVTPDSTSRYVIEEPAWKFITDTESVNNDNPAASIVAEVDVTNYAGVVVAIQVLTLDGGATEAIEALSPYRMLYIFGSAGSIGAAMDEGYAEVPGANTITPDLADGLTQKITLDRASTTINFPTYTGGTLTAGLRFTLKPLQDATGGRAVVWGSGYVGSATYPPLSAAPGVYDSFNFRIRPDGDAELDSVSLGHSET